MESLDKIDRQLVALLQTNSRDTTTTLARKLGVARTTVHERIARMERNGLIRGYSVVLNRDPFGQYVTALVFLTVLKQRQSNIVEQLKRLPEVKLCQTVNGACDLVCQIEVPQLEDLEALIVEISSINGVNGARSMIVTAIKFDRRLNALASPTSIQAAGVSRGEAG